MSRNKMDNENFTEDNYEQNLPNDLLQEFGDIFEGGNFRLKVKLVNKSTNPLPTYAKYGDSGFDLRANLPQGSVTIEPLKRCIIPTGNYFQIPMGYEMEIRPRSGLAAKHGITVLNAPGTIDAGFRGEVCAILFNTDEAPFTINHGDRICQAVITPVVHNAQLVEVEELDPSDRGDGGFGHSGIK